MDNPGYLPGQSAFDAPPPYSTQADYGGFSTQPPPPTGAYQPPTIPSIPPQSNANVNALMSALSQSAACQVLANQPKKPDVWAPLPGAVGGCPHGLEYLLQLSEILVDPHDQTCGEFKGYQFGPKYMIRNPAHHKMYFAAEESGENCRACCQPCHGFCIDMADQRGNVVLKFERPFTCVPFGCCFPCLLHKMTVSSADGSVLGYVEQEWVLYTPTLTVRDAEDNVVFNCVGPSAGPVWQTDSVKEFRLFTKGSGKIGMISKKWNAKTREIVGVKDSFKIECPADLDVKIKACLIGTAMLMDYLYFAGVPPPAQRRRGGRYRRRAGRRRRR